MSKDGGLLEPIQLVQQTLKTSNNDNIHSKSRNQEANTSFQLPQAPLNHSPNMKNNSSKKRKLDETTPKIDMFIEQAAKKKKVII